MPTAADTATQIWMAATQHPLGIGVVVTDMARAKVQLYTARKRLMARGVVGLDKYKIKTSPLNPASELYIIKDLAA